MWHTTCHFLFALWKLNTTVFLQIPTSLTMLTNIAWDFNSQTLSIFLPSFTVLCFSVPSKELTTVCFQLLTACYVVCAACFKMTTTCCGQWPQQSLCHQGWGMLCNNYSVQRGIPSGRIKTSSDNRTKGVSAHKAVLGFILCCLWTKLTSRAMQGIMVHVHLSTVVFCWIVYCIDSHPWSYKGAIHWLKL